MSYNSNLTLQYTSVMYSRKTKRDVANRRERLDVLDQVPRARFTNNISKGRKTQFKYSLTYKYTVAYSPHAGCDEIQKPQGTRLHNSSGELARLASPPFLPLRVTPRVDRIRGNYLVTQGRYDLSDVTRNNIQRFFPRVSDSSVDTRNRRQCRFSKSSSSRSRSMTSAASVWVAVWVVGEVWLAVWV
jgi:hypothetical protein